MPLHRSCFELQRLLEKLSVRSTSELGVEEELGGRGERDQPRILIGVQQARGFLGVLDASSGIVVVGPRGLRVDLPAEAAVVSRLERRSFEMLDGRLVRLVDGRDPA